MELVEQSKQRACCNIPIPFKILQAGILTEMAFHEKAGVGVKSILIPRTFNPTEVVLNRE